MWHVEPLRCSNRVTLLARQCMTLLPTSLFMISDSENNLALDSRRSCTRGRGRFTRWTTHLLQLTLASRHALTAPSGTAGVHTLVSV